MSKAPLTLPLVQLAHGIGLPLPAYATPGAAGLDLVAALAEGEDMILKTGERGLVPTGLALQLPGGYEAQVRPRSGLALKHGITVLNSPGTIDADYRGEVCVLLVNFGPVPYTIRRGERIAQMVIAAVSSVEFVRVETLEGTIRGSGGYGSTGS